MQEISAGEAIDVFQSILDRVELGEEFVITRHGKPVARLITADESTDRAKATAAANRIRARTQRLTSEPFDWSALKSDREAGLP